MLRDVVLVDSALGSTNMQRRVRAKILYIPLSIQLGKSWTIYM